MISDMIGDIAAGSVKATPNVGSATIDYATKLPALLIAWVGGFVKTLGL